MAPSTVHTRRSCASSTRPTSNNNIPPQFRKKLMVTVTSMTRPTFGSHLSPRPRPRWHWASPAAPRSSSRSSRPRGASPALARDLALALALPAGRAPARPESESLSSAAARPTTRTGAWAMRPVPRQARHATRRLWLTSPSPLQTGQTKTFAPEGHEPRPSQLWHLRTSSSSIWPSPPHSSHSAVSADICGGGGAAPQAPPRPRCAAARDADQAASQARPHGRAVAALR
mmetsp:Transcript_7491/g.21350  ORF Transcript_7491/g.21350 Transcript_7491/m.21350 type:complete len:229 (+) Transcript_7491:230-916(+)